MNGIGTIQVFTGEGKGKTTAALGLAWRAVGRGLKVFMIQFLKAPETSGEHFAAEAFGPLLTIKPMGRKGFIRRRGCEPLDTVMAELALEEASSAMLSGHYDMIILDEINMALHLGLIRLQDLLHFMKSKPENVELVLTGRYAHPQVIELADSVLEMRKIKHHFDSGIPAREGIEY
ncbi:MAG: cob(I)yrinic acid a,c-diamide adenosyltransferase [Desulfomonile tiedjei]|uniref:corrinoid adenosyltransferase n=1 Tax=Desulfomonile tiedjei TaxID=2358 RepID=A0A9D6Z6K5_9BACT|nr:cob(I)yrinic acid a,c-diamide adenosyltransferase [Desulfomonile tiedjei]